MTNLPKKVGMDAALMVALLQLTGCPSWIMESVQNSVEVAESSRQCVVQNVDGNNSDQMDANGANYAAAERARGIADITAEMGGADGKYTAKEWADKQDAADAELAAATVAGCAPVWYRCPLDGTYNQDIFGTQGQRRDPHT
jgi:hypothetical protein